jgi:hypothetical protein
MMKYKVTRRGTGEVHYLTGEELAKIPRAQARAKARTSGRRVVMRDLKGKSHTRHGHHYPGEEMRGHHAEIVPGESIRLHGTETNRVGGPIEYDITFHVGDDAVYGGYNLTYTGPIMKIAANTITINAGSTGRSRAKRLTIAEFSRENRDYDAEKIAKHNASWTD